MALEDLDTIIQGLATALRTIDGLTVYAEPLESIRESPAAYILPAEMLYDQTFGGDAEIRLVVTVLVSTKAGFAEAHAKLRKYMARDSEGSIKDAIDDDPTLGGSCAFCVCKRAYEYGGHEYNGEQFLGVRFEMQILED